MENVQATLEFSLHLHQYQGLFPAEIGNYRIGASINIPRSIPHATEARIFHTRDGLEYPATVEGKDVCSSVFRINHDQLPVEIDDVVIFSINALLDESKIEETLNALESKLIFNLYYAEMCFEFNNFEHMDLICSQEVTVRFNLHGGIHDHMNVVFVDLTELSITVHGLLVVLQPALMRFEDKRSVFTRILPSRWMKTKVPKMESVIFGKNFKKKLAADGKSSVIEGQYLQHAYRFLSALRSCLLLSYDGFYSYFSSVSETLPSPCKLELENLNMKARLSDLSDKVTEIEDPSDLAEAINASLLELSAQLLNLWGTFLQFSLKEEMEAFIRQELQKIREEKLSKSFFSTEHPRQEALSYDEKIAQSHKQISKEKKKSPKVHCPLESLVMDILRSPPVIFEDRYLEPVPIDDSSSPDVSPEEELEPRDDIIEKLGEETGSRDNFSEDSLMRELYRIKEELRQLIQSSLCTDLLTLAPKYLCLSLVLDNSSYEGIFVHFKMSHKYVKNKQRVFISFSHGLIGGRPNLLLNIGKKEDILAGFNSLANDLVDQIVALKRSKGLDISRIRLLLNGSENGKRDLLWDVSPIIEDVPREESSSSVVERDESISYRSKENLLLESDKGEECASLKLSTISFDNKDSSREDNGTHLIVCAHGLGGSNFDLMLVRHYIEAGVTRGNTYFLMSESYTDYISLKDIDFLATCLLYEILNHIRRNFMTVSRISFIGFSLGNVIIRALLCHPEFKAYLGKLHTFLSFGGPHLGLLYHSSIPVKIGMWCLRWKKNHCMMQQASLADDRDPRQTFIYKLSQKPGLEHFRNLVLVSSLQDKMVPYHSACIEMCKAALRSNTLGTVYSEMVQNILEPVLKNKNCNFVRYDFGLDLPTTCCSIIDNAAHCVLIASWQVLENFFQNAALDYFK
ncbi:hypothetical protein XENTR_v10024623 [Xenopus tropicalis]|uniref:Protein FAM135A-like n=1 Tax=Xenopus tropicalis TaxID=8364 RepID=A0A8J1IY96_XENTR|nr:protein FAM135A-like [Xenopus tropicalis]KAE8580994.1 hypothetical protein XENTR_v10024623 [Xenopus tropicalis]KAE8580995.1 hypothetical protein XENTR_v10024623 [Xenopus tropicalis]